MDGTTPLMLILKGLPDRLKDANNEGNHTVTTIHAPMAYLQRAEHLNNVQNI